MKVRLPSGQSEDYEVRIEYNRSKYPLKPHIAMTEATRLIRNHENNQVERVSLTLPEIPKVSFFQVESVTEDVPEPRSKSSDATNNGEDAKQDSTSSSHANSLKKKKVHYYLSIAGGRFKVPLQAVGYVATMMIFFFTGLGFMLFRKPKSKSD